MWVAFAVQKKATHIFSAKNIRILYIESAKTVNEMTLNELVKLTKLWTTGSWKIGFDISCSVSWEKLEKYFRISSAEMFT